MPVLTRDSSFKPVSPVHSHSYVDVEDDANEIFAAAFVQRTATGRAVIVNDTGGLGFGPIIGVNERNVPDQLGKTYSGPFERPTAKVYQGLFERPIASSNPVTDADMFKTVYAANNSDVTSDGSKPVLGVMVGINNDAGTCTVLVSGSANAALSALAGSGEIPIPLSEFFLETGTPLAAFADAASPTPGRAYSANAEAAGIRWNNAESSDAIVAPFAIPADFDPSQPSQLVITASKVGATSADTPTFVVELYEQVVGSAYDAGSNLGGSTTAMADEPTKEVQSLTLDFAADTFSDPSAGNLSASISLQPETGELVTDDLILHSVRIRYTPII